MKNFENNNAQSTDSAYLDKLEFTPDKRNTWLNFFVTNFRVVILLIVLISGWGIYSFTQLPRESNPEVKIAMAIISAGYPGASPSDIEELVTKKIETDISGVSGIKKITSTSSNSFATVVVEFDADQNVDDSVRKLRDKLPTIKNDLPADATDPQVKEISLDDTPIVTFALVGPYDGFTLRTYAEKIQNELEKNPGIREVNISGGDQSEFEVAYDPQKLALYNITAEQSNQVSQPQTVQFPRAISRARSLIIRCALMADFMMLRLLVTFRFCTPSKVPSCSLKTLLMSRKRPLKKLCIRVFRPIAKLRKMQLPCKLSKDQAVQSLIL